MNEIEYDGADLSGSGRGPVASSWGHGIEPTGSIQGLEFLNWLLVR
jgi:hypothetical protein